MDVSPDSLDALLNGALLHFLQSHTNLRFRHGIAAGLASAVNALIERQPPAPEAPSVAQAQRLADEGWVGLGQVLVPDDVAKLVAYFEQRPCFNGAVPTMSDRVPRRVGEGAERFAHGSYPLADVIAAPGLLELANRPEILSVADAYLGCTPTLYSLQVGWSFAGSPPFGEGAHFHRWDDDYKFCTLVAYLTDVRPDNGPQMFIRRSHRADLVEAIVRDAARGRAVAIDDLFQMNPSDAHDRLYGELFARLVDTIAGPAGFAFVADTSGLHKELPVLSGRRLVARAHYGLYRNTRAAVMGEGAVPPAALGRRLPADARTVYVNRCLIR
jgi:hypothetical protein